MNSRRAVCIVQGFRRSALKPYVLSLSYSAGQSVASSAVVTGRRCTAGGGHRGDGRRGPASRGHAARPSVRGRHAIARSASAVGRGRRPDGAPLLQLLAEPHSVAFFLGQSAVPARLDCAGVHVPPALLVAKAGGANHADGTRCGHRPARGELRAAAVLRHVPHRDDRHVHVCAGTDGRVSAGRRLEHVPLVVGPAGQPDFHVPTARRSNPVPAWSAADRGHDRQHLHTADDRARRVSRRQSDHPWRWTGARRG